jgi:F0F1-type ATP synthase membrane subunit b/b'
VLTVTVTATGVVEVVGLSVHGVQFSPSEEGEATVGEEDAGPSPIAPEVKEIAWGAGSFIVLFVVMRLFLLPKVRNGMHARYGKIRGDHDAADAARAAARAEVADYQAQLASVKAEAAARIEAARATLEAERSAAVAEVNSRIAARRAEATAANEAARAAAAEHIRSAVADVSGRAVELAIGRRPSASAVDEAVDGVMSAAGGR